MSTQPALVRLSLAHGCGRKQHNTRIADRSVVLPVVGVRRHRRTLTALPLRRLAPSPVAPARTVKHVPCQVVRWGQPSLSKSLTSVGLVMLVLMGSLAVLWL